MVAKNNKAHEFLAHQLEEKTTHRKYYALVWGVIKNDTGTIDAPIGGGGQGEIPEGFTGLH